MHVYSGVEMSIRDAISFRRVAVGVGAGRRSVPGFRAAADNARLPRQASRGFASAALAASF
jgi:hypothetical protein